MSGPSFVSVCSGAEAASLALGPLGFQAKAFSEVDPFCCALLDQRFPGVPNLGDMTRWREWDLPAADMLVGGTPCFTDDAMVLTESGYLPINEVMPGDRVMTHKGRLRTVLRIGSKISKAGRIVPMGMPEGVGVTGNHPFLSVSWRNQNTRRNNEYARIEHCGDPEWTEAKDMPGKQWCALISYEQSMTKPVSSKFDEKTAMYVAGMYLGDGHIRGWSGKSKKALILSLNEEKMEKLKKRIGSAIVTITQERTSLRAHIYDTDFCNWIEKNFQSLSHKKVIPAWVYGSKFRDDLVQGYLDTDGWCADGKISITTTSRKMAYGVCDLLNAQGYVSSVGFVKMKETCVIEGRIVNQKDQYQVRAWLQEKSPRSRVRHGMLLRTVKSFEGIRQAKVYNLEVEEDHTYIVNGAVVHNCQAWSHAGLRKSMKDDRANLAFEFVELFHAGGFACALWENVPGVLNTKDNAFGCFLGGLVGAGDALPEPPDGSWPDAGMVAGPGARAAWRILDAQYWGVAQRRRRVFVVASARDWIDPVAILFERQGVQGHPSAGGEAWPDVAGTLTASFGERGGGGLAEAAANGHILPLYFGGNNSSGPIDVSTTLSAHGGPAGRLDFDSETFVTHALTGEGFDASEDGTGRGTPLVPVGFRQSSEFGQFDGGQPTLRAKGADVGQGGEALIAYGGAIRGRDDGAQIELIEEMSPALRGSDGGGSRAIAFDARQSDVCVYGDRTGALDTDPYTYGIHASYGVRRLTPVECERLMGMPDNHTNITYRSKPAADGPRYRAIGNSWAVPVVRWIGERIKAQFEAQAARNEAA